MPAGKPIQIDQATEYNIRINERFRACLVWSEGEIIRENFLSPPQISVSQLVKAFDIDTAKMIDIVRGRRGITADTAPGLSRYLGASAEFWVGLRGDYELRVASQEKMKQTKRDIQLRDAAA